MTGTELDDLQSSVTKAWSRATAKQWTEANPAAGQCNVTAVVVQELASGEIVKTPMADGYHFYNLIDNRRHDFTAVQFDRPVRYEDIPSSREDALAGVTQAEYQAMRSGVR